ncbi:MAG: glycosyltransferase family 25 protein [Gemmatimonas sp.]
MVQKLKAIGRRGAPSLRNVLFSYFNYWPVSSLADHWLADMPVYCITLKRAVKRRANMERQARLMGLRQLHFVEAVDASKLSVEQLIADGIYDKGESLKWHTNGLTLNEVACSLSHAACYRRMVEAGVDRAIVIEDDALFRTRRLARLELSRVPEWADLLFLNAFYESTPPKERVAPYLYSDQSYLGSCAAYMLTASAAARLLDAAIPVVHAADGLVGRALDWAGDLPHAFRQQGCTLKLRGVMVYPEAVTNGSTEHYYRSSLR